MKKNVKIKMAIISMGFICCLMIGFFSIYTHASWSEIQIEDEYEIFSKFTVPKRKVIVNGEKVDAMAVVTDPKGKTTKEDTINLSTAGMYTITYTASSGKKSYVDEITFQVYNKLYEFNSVNSSATYGKYAHAEDTKGLMIRLEEKDTFFLNQPIDITSLSDSDWLIQAYVMPDKSGEADFTKLSFRFTDVLDSSITLDVEVKAANWDPQLKQFYCAAGGNGQKISGRETALAEKVHRNNAYGAVLFSHSFGQVNKNPVNIRLDFSTMEVFADDKRVIGLNDPLDFDVLWKGFPSGKAYLTVSADGYTNSTANFCLSKVGNIDLSAEKVVDSNPPIITINTEYDKMPNAVKGGEYQLIPTATAVDEMSGKCKVNTSVWYNYQSENAIMVQAGKKTFKTPNIGQYAIVYEATDASGNIGREILWIRSEASLKSPVITPKATPQSTWNQGELFFAPEYTYECQSGIPDIKIYATKGEKQYDLKNGYRFEKKGTYTITYEITDCAGQTGTYEYELTVKAGDKPVLADEVLWPKYLIEGAEYEFPTIHFYDYRSGKKVQKVATGTIVDASGEKAVAAGGKYKPTVKANGDIVQIVYECENATYKVELPTIKSKGPVDGRTVLMLENYFVGNGYACEIGKEDIVFRATKADGGWEFANKLLAENFTTQLQGIAANSDFDSLVFVMTDYEDRTKSVTVELLNNEKYLSVKTGDVIQPLGAGSQLQSEKVITLSCEAGVLSVNGIEIKAADLSAITSDYLYLSCTFKGATKNSAFKLLSLNNHIFGEQKADRTGAQIVALGMYGGRRELGKQFTTTAMVAGDVLNPNIEFTMTITDRAKKIVKDVNGLPMEDVDPRQEYVIDCDKIETYSIVCSAVDSFSAKKSVLSYTIDIADEIAPKLKFKGELVTEGKVGDTICIPSFTVSDNLTKKENIMIVKSVTIPHGAMLLIPEESNSVLCSEAGKYKFMVMAVDEMGNVTTESWITTITKE